jgi:hypothetical protein
MSAQGWAETAAPPKGGHVAKRGVRHLSQGFREDPARVFLGERVLQDFREGRGGPDLEAIFLSHVGEADSGDIDEAFDIGSGRAGQVHAAGEDRAFSLIGREEGEGLVHVPRPVVPLHTPEPHRSSLSGSVPQGRL